MDHEQQQHLEELHRTFQKRLRILEQQAALQGPRTLPETLIEIDELRSKVDTIETQLSGTKFGTIQTQVSTTVISSTPKGIQPPNSHGSLTCPSCLQIDAVKKVSALVMEGTTTTVRETTIDDKTTTETTTSQSHLAELLAPPSPPSEPSFANIGDYFGLYIFIALFISLIFIFLNSQNITNLHFLYFLIIYVIGLIATLVIVYYSKPLRDRQKEKFKGMLTIYERAWHKWNNLYYCSRCDALFSKGQSRIVSPHGLSKNLYE